MSSVRVSVEWLFGLVKNYFKFIDLKQMQIIGMSLVGKVYVVCALAIMRTLVYMVISISETFNMKPPNIRTTFSEKNVV